MRTQNRIVVLLASTAAAMGLALAGAATAVAAQDDMGYDVIGTDDMGYDRATGGVGTNDMGYD